MSSSATDDARRGHDAPDGRLGGRGHHHRVAQATRRLGRGRRVLVEISTDKVETEVPSPATGRVKEILVEVGETVDVGTLLATIETEARRRGGARR